MRDRFGPDSRTFTYVLRSIGDPSTQKDKLEDASPAKLAANFRAPVLLIHGAGDSVVEARQSQQMARALEGAGKTVEYMSIRDDDHNLSDGASRIAALQKIGAFVKAHTAKQ